jgi:glutaredoxin
MGKLVVIYTLNYCSYCAKLKGMLDKEGITYISKDIEDKAHINEYEIMKKRCNNELIPLIRIGNTLLVADKDFDKLDEALAKIKEIV